MLRLYIVKNSKIYVLMGGVEHLTTTLYYPLPSLAERVNRNLKAALKIFQHE